MSPITAKATQIRVLQHTALQLSTSLSQLDQGLHLCGISPEQSPVRNNLVNTIRSMHDQIGHLIGQSAMVAADQYEDNRGLTP